MSATITAFYNNKGGVAKTTSTVNIAGELSLQGKRVLIIDADPQGHSTYSFGKDADEIETELGTILYNNLSGSEAKDYFIHINDYLDIVPANQTLADFIGSVATQKNNDKYLEHFVSDIRDDYDFIFIDMAPAVDVILNNVVRIVDDLIVLSSPQPYAVRNTERTLSITDKYNVKVRRIVATNVDRRVNADKFFLDELKSIAENHNIKMAETIIPTRSAFRDSMTRYMMPLSLIDDKSYEEARTYYHELTKELGY